jgi:hypothetical protein
MKKTGFNKYTFYYYLFKFKIKTTPIYKKRKEKHFKTNFYSYPRVCQLPLTCQPS